LTHQNHPHLPFCTIGQNHKGTAKQRKDNANKTKKERDEETRHKQIDTHKMEKWKHTKHKRSQSCKKSNS